MLSCREAISRLADLESEALDPTEERAVKRHLARCEGCLAYWRTYRTTIALARGAYAADSKVPELPEDVARIVLTDLGIRRGFQFASRQAIHLLSGIAAGPLLALFPR